MVERVILIVIDSVGIGCLPDSKEYGDENCNTLSHVAEKNGGLNIPNMKKLGIGNIEGVFGIEEEKIPAGSYARMAEKSQGKDTITGHWEIAGIYTEKNVSCFSGRISGRSNKKVC
jgi:phosphopentomutase